MARRTEQVKGLITSETSDFLLFDNAITSQLSGPLYFREFTFPQ